MSDELQVEFDHNIFDMPQFRNRTGIFRDREHAGLILSKMLSCYQGTDALVLGVPAGGVPVAAPLARKLNLDLDVAVVNKVTLPWSTEAGYGAVAFDGTVRLNQDMISQMGLAEEEIKEGVGKASKKVERRLKEFRGEKSFPHLEDRPAILVDDGIASGFTMLVAVEALQNKGAAKIIIAVPTAHPHALQRVSHGVEEIHCANIRGGLGFAVADAYQNWYDVEEDEVVGILNKF